MYITRPHVSDTLILWYSVCTLLLCRVFFPSLHAKHWWAFVFFAEHFGKIAARFSALPSIFLLCQMHGRDEICSGEKKNYSAENRENVRQRKKTALAEQECAYHRGALHLWATVVIWPRVVYPMNGTDYTYSCLRFVVPILSITSCQWEARRSENHVEWWQWLGLE